MDCLLGQICIPPGVALRKRGRQQILRPSGGKGAAASVALSVCLCLSVCLSLCVARALSYAWSEDSPADCSDCFARLFGGFPLVNAKLLRQLQRSASLFVCRNLGLCLSGLLI